MNAVRTRVWRALGQALVVVVALGPARAGWAQDEPTGGSGDVRLGYVDIERALHEVEDGRQAMEQLQAELADRQTQLDQAEQDLRQFTDQLDQDLVMLDADARRARLEEYQQHVAAYQELYSQNQRQLYDLEQQATHEIVDRMLGIVQDIARERNLTMVFEKTRSALVWAQEDLDLTDELIQRYEARGHSDGSDSDGDNEHHHHPEDGD